MITMVTRVFLCDVSWWNYCPLLLNTSLHKVLCLSASFFSTNDEFTREQGQQLTQAEECEILLWDTSKFIQISRSTNVFEHISTEHIIDNVMINHLTCFLNKPVLAFKRDNHLETLSSVKPWYFPCHEWRVSRWLYISLPTCELYRMVAYNIH